MPTDAIQCKPLEVAVADRGIERAIKQLKRKMATEVMSVISELASAGQTMNVVTHQLGLVRAVADTVHVFAGGRRVESGPTATVFDHPTHEKTRAFLHKLQAW